MDTIPPSSSSQHLIVTGQGVFEHHVAWSPPPENSWKLNFSGSVSHLIPGIGGAAFTIRDGDAIFMMGFATPVPGVKNELFSELVALSSGLSAAVSLGIDSLELEGHSGPLFTLLREGVPPRAPSKVRALVEECTDLLRAFRYVAFSHVNIHGNAAADRLAALVTRESGPCYWPDSPPSVIANLLLDDVIGRWIHVSGP